MNHTIKKLQISCLIENNSSSDRLLHEHALSFHIKADNTTILFDAGRTDALLTNMKTLEIPPEFDRIVLSHSHYDHTGNLKEIVKINSKTSQVYVGDGLAVPKWRKPKTANTSAGAALLYPRRFSRMRCRPSYS